MESRFTPGWPRTVACISHRITDVEKTAPSLGGRRWASSSQSPLSPLPPQAAKAARAPLLSSEPPVILRFSPVILRSFPVILSGSEGSVPPPFMQRWGRRTDSSACGLRMTREQSRGTGAAWPAGAPYFRRLEMTWATFTPDAPAWARPRVMPAPSPMANMPGSLVSSSGERVRREE